MVFGNPKNSRKIDDAFKARFDEILRSIQAESREFISCEKCSFEFEKRD